MFQLEFDDNGFHWCQECSILATTLKDFYKIYDKEKLVEMERNRDNDYILQEAAEKIDDRFKREHITNNKLGIDDGIVDKPNSQSDVVDRPNSESDDDVPF